MHSKFIKMCFYANGARTSGDAKRREGETSSFLAMLKPTLDGARARRVGWREIKALK